MSTDRTKTDDELVPYIPGSARADSCHIVHCPACGNGFLLAVYRPNWTDPAPGGQPPGFPGDLVNTEEARLMLGDVSREVLDELVEGGAFNQYRLNERVIRYSRAEILHFLTVTAVRNGQEACRRKAEGNRARRAAARQEKEGAKADDGGDE